MKISNTLTQLLEKPHADNLLQRKSNARSQVRALQVLLYGLGFGEALNWAKYQADGDYGGSTTRAVQQFLQRNGLSGDGADASAEVIELMLARYRLLPALRQLRQTLNKGALATVYVPGAPAVHDLRQLAQAAGVTITAPTPGEGEARALLEKASRWYGENWPEAIHEADAEQQQADAEINKLGNAYQVNDAWFRVKFTQHKSGVFTVGEEKTPDFIDTNRQQLLDRGMTESAVRVITPVSANEGNLDAINTWDNCFLTFGMFQWTVGQNNNAGELPALLQRVKEADPEAFAEYFGRHGLDVAEASKTVGFFSLDGKKIVTAAQKETFRDGPAWAFRFWRAGLDPRVQLVEVMHALDRLNSFLEHPHYMPLDRFHVGDLITSEYGACLILDHHVNRPGHLMNFQIGRMDILGKALKNAGLANSDPRQWGTAEEAKLIAAYLPLRFASSMTHSQERAAKIKGYLDRGDLSAERGSLILGGTRDLLGPSPEDYPLIDPMEYETRGE